MAERGSAVESRIESSGSVAASSSRARTGLLGSALVAELVALGADVTMPLRDWVPAEPAGVVRRSSIGRTWSAAI